jgi:phage terminase large subunit-like protein
LDGIIQDENYLPILYCIDEGDSWENPKVWPKANPCLGVSLKEDFLVKSAREASQIPSLQVEFRCKNMCEWLSNEHSWISYRYWEKCVENAKKFKFDKKKPYYANLSIDLSRSNDLTSLTLCIYQGGKYFMKHWLYFPKDSLSDRIKTETELWNQWFEKGVVTSTPGKTIDYEFMINEIGRICEEYDISECLYDPYCSNKIISDLENSLILIPIPQNLKNLSPYTKSYEKAILDGDIVDGNDFMKWAVSNAMIYEDANGNIKLVKNSRKGKSVENLHIDPVITSLMGLGRIKSLLDSGDIDLRNVEEIQKETHDFLKDLKL